MEGLRLNDAVLSLLWAVAGVGYLAVARFLEHLYHQRSDPTNLSGHVPGWAVRLYAVLGMAFAVGFAVFVLLIVFLVRGGRDIGAALLAAILAVVLGLGTLVGGLVWTVRSQSLGRRLCNRAAFITIVTSVIAAVYGARWGW